MLFFLGITSVQYEHSDKRPCVLVVKLVFGGSESYFFRENKLNNQDTRRYMLLSHHTNQRNRMQRYLS